MACRSRGSQHYSLGSPSEPLAATSPSRQRNRFWQMDFCEFETTRGGIWRICAVIDYATKYCLAAGHCD